MKPCKSANYFVKAYVHVVMNVQQGKSVNIVCEKFCRQNVSMTIVYFR